MKKSCPTSPHNAGFILPMTLIFLLIVGISLSGVFGYTNYVTRSMARSSSETICRLAAQSVVEEAKQEIYKQFSDYYKKEKHLFSASLDTFFTTVTESNAVGPAGYSTTYPTAGVTRNGCTVKVTFSAYDVTSDRLRQDLVIRAQATTTTPLGQKVSRTIEETAAFVLAQSEVFNYAYFINNKGWYEGGGGTTNGDVRANGNFQLDDKCVVNGAIYAARNEERGDHGNIYGGKGIAYNASNYLSQYDVRARPLNHYTNDRNTEADDVSWGMGYDPSLRNDASRDYGTYAQSEPLNMPYLGDLEGYIDLAKGKVYTGGNKETPKIDKVFTTEMAGPSKSKYNPDAGCVLLIGGSAENPIEIEGTVVVAGDVLIKGYIKGQGAIYAGRNIHILGDLKYVNPPQWSVDSNMTETELNAQAEKNASKDLLVLAAKGNVVLGNYASSDWKAATGEFLNGYRPDIIRPYQCDDSDASIGYPKNFNGRYGAKDGGMRLSLNKTTGTYQPKRDRCYYQSSVGEHIINMQATIKPTTIDAVIYNNHAIIGHLGNNVVFNGAVICRDEVLIYGGGYNSRIKFNWDIRLGSRSRDNLYLRNRGINPNNIVHMPLAPKSAQLVRWCEYLK